jgi:hypothetical protein
MESFFYSPYVVPLGAFVVAVVAIISGAVAQAHSRRIKAEQRMALLARGVPLAEIEGFLNAGRENEERLPSSPARRMANSRRTAMVLISIGVGVILLGLALTVIVRERDVLSVAAAGLVPFSIGVGFLADYNLQKNEIARLGIGLEDERRSL